MPDTISANRRRLDAGYYPAEWTYTGIPCRTINEKKVEARERGEGRERIASTDPRKVRQKYLKTSTKPRFTPKKNEANQQRRIGEKARLCGRFGGRRFFLMR